MRNNRIFLLLLTLLFLLSGCARSKTGIAVPPDAASATAAKTAPEGEEFLQKLYFLGDSTTAHMTSRAPGIPKNHILAAKNRYLNLDAKITSARIVNPESGKEETPAEVVRQLAPEYLLITLGVDYGVYYYRNTPDTFRRCYEKLLDAIEKASPGTRVIAGGIFPVGRSSPVITNEMVDRANQTIRELATERGIPFADNNSILKDDEGFLDEKYVYSEDGIHLNAAAYAVILHHLAELAPILGG